MKIWKRAGMFVLDLITVYIPVILFSFMFICFILQIFSRYVLNDPWVWPNEASVLTFVWVVLLGSCYAIRKSDVVEFTVIFDKLPPKGQGIVSAINHMFIAACTAVAFYPIYDYISFLSMKKTPVMSVPFSIVYGPFLFTLLFLFFHSCYKAISDIRRSFGKPTNTAGSEVTNPVKGGEWA